MNEFYYPTITTDINVWLGTDTRLTIGETVHHAFINEIKQAGIHKFGLQSLIEDNGISYATITNEVALEWDQMNESDVRCIVLDKLSKFRVLNYISYYVPKITSWADKSQLYITRPKLIFKGILK